MFIHRRVSAAGVWLAVSLACASVRAQSVPELTPPVAQSSTDVAYPEGAAGDAAVVVESVVEKDGSVSSATVVEGVDDKAWKIYEFGASGGPVGAVPAKTTVAQYEARVAH